MHYNNSDYTHITKPGTLNSPGTPNPFAEVNGSLLGTSFRPLYNGNIAAMSVNIGKFDKPLIYNYQYDQLNRLAAMDAYNGLQANNTWQPVLLNDYAERITYDANGNIKTYLRNGAASAQGLVMDNLTYNYDYYDANGVRHSYVPGATLSTGDRKTNRLNFVSDAATASAYTEDIKSHSTNNYEYDAIGNLTRDISEGITSITWNVYGKIASIVKTDKTVSYTYDASGNRIGKTVTASGSTKSTWYVRDATGNVMAIYENGNTAINSGRLSQTEVDLYGSSRLGLWHANRDVELWPAPPSTSMPGITNGGITQTIVRGDKIYELSNHLGNVLVVISDRKVEIEQASTTLIDHYEAFVVNANDYYPFGMMMPGRKYSAENGYRYGFNGKEVDNEIKGEGNQQDYGMRIYDPRIGKFLSVDPLANKYPELTPYQFSSNMPICAVDIDGLEAKVVVVNQYYGKSGNFMNITNESVDPNRKPVDGQHYEVHKSITLNYDKNGKCINQEIKIVSDQLVPNTTPSQNAEKPSESKDPSKKYDVSELSVSDMGIKFFAKQEGVILHPYNDSKHYSTVGIGHLIAYRPKNDQDFKDWAWLDTEQEAYDLLKKDLKEKYEPAVKRLVKVPLTQAQYDAVVSFTYNVGEGSTDPNKKPGLAGSMFLKTLNAGTYNGNLMLNYRKPVEIEDRREDEVKLFNTGSYEYKGVPIL